MAVSAEVREKERRVRELMRQKGLGALLLKRQANFSWLTAGGLNLVGITTEVGAASLLITEEGKYVISNNIEAPRMAAEENLEAQGYEIRSFPWYEEREAAAVAEIVGAGALGSDCPFPNAVVLTEEIARLRYSLTA
ncbi:MAG: aminopeptidase P family N-terminal domain-containing protein, partial [Syntrophales bacterium]|nr:aminopeptidase P family N-terminal domain-containing protein [Syntrophales bacterium]